MRTYQDMVFSTAARLCGNEAQAEDIAQETFVRAYENFSHLRRSPKAGGWLKTVTINLALNHLSRHRKRWRLSSELKGSSNDDDAAPEFDAEIPDTLLMDVNDAQRQRLIDAALKRLPEKQRVVLVLYHFEELSYQEIAEKLQFSLAKVKTDILRARAALLTIFRRNGRIQDTLDP
jgi:RNA polymerase sigma-70 factor (ECF subfamily)